jgi:hypothetical protein
MAIVRIMTVGRSARQVYTSPQPPLVDLLSWVGLKKDARMGVW